MNKRRISIVLQAFRKFDQDNSGVINIDDLKGVYDSSKHPDVKSGKKTEDEILYEFLDTFEMHHGVNVSICLIIVQHPKSKDRNITEEEFLEYYNNLSCTVDNDEYFETIIKRAWNLDDSKVTKKGWSAEN